MISIHDVPISSKPVNSHRFGGQLYFAFFRVKRRKETRKFWANGRRQYIMAFTKIPIKTNDARTNHGSHQACENDIWTIFRALRDARSTFGLRPGHIQTLQAMLSFLKPGHGETVFASNNSICQRAHGIDERTLRRHISRFVELGFVTRNDSSNQKRYRIRASNGECISYGLSVAPLLQRASELISIAQEIENSRRDRVFVRKQILAKLAHLEEHDPSNAFIHSMRKVLRRKLNLSQYRALLVQVDMECKQFSTTDTSPEPTKLTANDGQTVRHQSRSEKDRKDLEEHVQPLQLHPETLTTVCEQATSFTTKSLRTWVDIEMHARTLAPMMGIHLTLFDKARRMVGAERASCAIFLILQLGQRVRDFGAYFRSVTIGQRRDEFDPIKLVERLSKTERRLA